MFAFGTMSQSQNHNELKFHIWPLLLSMLEARAEKLSSFIKSKFLAMMTQKQHFMYQDTKCKKRFIVGFNTINKV